MQIYTLGHENAVNPVSNSCVVTWGEFLRPYTLSLSVLCRHRCHDNFFKTVISSLKFHILHTFQTDRNLYYSSNQVRILSIIIHPLSVNKFCWHLLCASECNVYWAKPQNLHKLKHHRNTKGYVTINEDNKRITVNICSIFHTCIQVYKCKWYVSLPNRNARRTKINVW